MFFSWIIRKARQMLDSIVEWVVSLMELLGAPGVGIAILFLAA